MATSALSAADTAGARTQVVSLVAAALAAIVIVAGVILLGVLPGLIVTALISLVSP